MAHPPLGVKYSIYEKTPNITHPLKSMALALLSE